MKVEVIKKEKRIIEEEDFPCLLTLDNGAIVLAIADSTETDFIGMLLKSRDNEEYYGSFSKENFKKYDGKIILSND